VIQDLRRRSEVAAGDIVPVPGAQFEETLASANPDLLQEMIPDFAQRMMDADVEVRCNAGYGEVTPDRVNSRNGYPAREWDTRAGTGPVPAAGRGPYTFVWIDALTQKSARAAAP
jgi:putative transposase